MRKNYLKKGVQPVMTNAYPIFEWIPGNPIDNKDDVQDTEYTDEGNAQKFLHKDFQVDQYFNKTEYEHSIDEEDSDSKNDDDNDRDKENDIAYYRYTEHENTDNGNEK